jgi:hypothetical protein
LTPTLFFDESDSRKRFQQSIAEFAKWGQVKIRFLTIVK